jgi:heptosyltransferase I
MSVLTFDQPPQSLCIIRLSAIGDVTHLLPVIATLQQQWPDTKITWIIGSLEYQLVKTLPGIEFIVFDKSKGLAEYFTLGRTLSGRQFSVVLMMQVALRASLISLLVKSKIRIGYDHKRSRDSQSLFCNQQIEGPDRVHVMDTFFQFIEKLGITKRKMDWLVKADEPARQFARDIIQQQATIIINPCSSARKNNWRNWPQLRYAELIDSLLSQGYRVIISGGPSAQELRFVTDILEHCQQQPVNLVGKTTLMQLLALIEQASCLIAPDTGPAHMGTVAGIPVVGLYASSNPLRTGPYNSQAHVVNAYPEALQRYSSRSLEQARWGERVRHPEVMHTIRNDEVMKKISNIMRTMQQTKSAGIE